ncbi:MAG: hypothetical protein JXA93_00065 [Anaerolineae bacterium]|nr:hypothetical protein [Anaerolineae bacterium]
MAHNQLSRAEAQDAELEIRDSGSSLSAGRVTLAGPCRTTTGPCSALAGRLDLVRRRKLACLAQAQPSARRLG